MNKKIAAMLVIFLVVGLVSLGSYYTIQDRPIADGYLTVSVNGYVFNKNIDNTENFTNGKIIIEISPWVDMEDVLDQTVPFEIEISGENETWSIPFINLRENSGKTEMNYGENIFCIGVAPGPENSEYNLYVKISAPTDVDGKIKRGMVISVEIWPTKDPVTAVSGTSFVASFDNEAEFKLWDENSIVSFFIVHKGQTQTIGGGSATNLKGT